MIIILMVIIVLAMKTTFPLSANPGAPPSGTFSFWKQGSSRKRGQQFRENLPVRHTR